jgi:hypothetical protein
MEETVLEHRWHHAMATCRRPTWPHPSADPSICPLRVFQQRLTGVLDASVEGGNDLSLVVAVVEEWLKDVSVSKGRLVEWIRGDTDIYWITTGHNA